MPRNGCSKEERKGEKCGNRFLPPQRALTPAAAYANEEGGRNNVPNTKCQRERSRVEDTTIAATRALAECLKTWAPLLAQKLPIHSMATEKKIIRQRHLSIKVDKARRLAHLVGIDSIWRKRRPKNRQPFWGGRGKKWAELRSARVRASQVRFFFSPPPSRARQGVGGGRDS